MSFHSVLEMPHVAVTPAHPALDACSVPQPRGSSPTLAASLGGPADVGGGFGPGCEGRAHTLLQKHLPHGNLGVVSGDFPHPRFHRDNCPLFPV